MNINEKIARQKAIIATEKLFIYASFLALGQSILIKNNIYTLSIINLEIIGLTALVNSKSKLKLLKCKQKFGNKN